MSLIKEIKRRNVFRVAIAYVVIAWLIMQVGDTLAPALHLPESINTALAFFLILGFPLAIFLAWAYELTPDGLKKEQDVDRSSSIAPVTGRKLDYVIIAMLVLALGYFSYDKLVLSTARDAALVEATTQALSDNSAAEPVKREESDNSIAVLPFVNMSDDDSNEYFSDGITEEVLNLLAKIPELRVTSRSSVFSLKGQNLDIPTVAKKLNVAYILEGSVRKSGNRVRITVQLIEVGSDVHMWSETFDRELDDIFAIQDEIATEVVQVLQVEILGDSPETRKTDTKAYTAYLTGKHFYELGDRVAAQDAFTQAIEIDPSYAPAWAGLSRTLRAMADHEEIDLHDGIEKARQSAYRALELDNTLADAWASLASIQYVYDWNWSQAEGTSRTALMHEPNNAYALRAASRIAEAIGNNYDALNFALKAVDVDPLNRLMLFNLGSTYWKAGQFEQAEELTRRVMELYPDHKVGSASLGRTLLAQGKPEEALQVIRESPNETARIVGNAKIHYDLGNMEEAERALRYLLENKSSSWAYQIAEIYAYKGDPDKAFEWLETSFEQRDGGIINLLSDHDLKSLHEDPRWEPYLLKLGLLDYWKILKAKRGQPGS